jgi:hypothetical protein
MLATATLIALLSAVPAPDRDTLARARTAYNGGQYDAAIAAAIEARKSPALASAASLVLARAYLERYRTSANSSDLASAREALGAIRAGDLDARSRLELVIGLGQSLYLDDEFGPAAELFGSALETRAVLEPSARERLLDWWATAMDRLAQVRDSSDRDPIYRRMASRMEGALGDDPMSPAASYWLVAGARGAGDLDRAWDAAIAAWVRAPCAPDGGDALRSDLDRLVVQALIPERARARAGTGDAAPEAARLRDEWEGIKRKVAAPSPSPPSSSSQSPRPPSEAPPG